MNQQQVDGHANPPNQPIVQPIVQPNVVAGALPNPAVNRIQVRVPPFWKQNPQLWFKQIEAQFANSHIVADLTKFNTIIGTVESDILSSVSDLVLNPPAANLYETIKQRLILEFTDTDNKKLNSLFHELTLGDSKSSSLLRKMRELSCGKVGAELLKTLWLQKLPTTIQTVLATSNDNLDQLTAMADTMFDITENSSISTISLSQTTSINDLVNVVHQLEGKIESLQKVFHEPRSSSVRSSRNRSATPFKASLPSNQNFCYYHKHFGQKAIKCKPLCNYQKSISENSNASQTSRQLTMAQK